MVEPTEEQIIEHARNTCAYFTADRSRAIEWPYLIHENEDAFVEMCGKSETVFLNNPAWCDVVSSSNLAKHLELIKDHSIVLAGNLGNVCGCNLVTDAFCLPVARDKDQATIYFIPR